MAGDESRVRASVIWFQIRQPRDSNGKVRTCFGISASERLVSWQLLPRTVVTVFEVPCSVRELKLSDLVELIKSRAL
jgi:hypothetical protein